MVPGQPRVFHQSETQNGLPFAKLFRNFQPLVALGGQAVSGPAHSLSGLIIGEIQWPTTKLPH